MSGIFVTGTDTGVGKTVVAAILVRLLDAEYWKPLQTGLADEPGDSTTVAHLANPSRIHRSAYTFAASLSPAAAAELEGVRIDPSRLTLPATDKPLIVEGAGGVLVPITGDLLMIDLIHLLGLPVVIVARTTLGTINHTLLTLHALRAREIPIHGIILNGPPNRSNRDAIEHHGANAVLVELEPLGSSNFKRIGEIAEAWGKSRALPVTW